MAKPGPVLEGKGTKPGLSLHRARPGSRPENASPILIKIRPVRAPISTILNMTLTLEKLEFLTLKCPINSNPRMAQYDCLLLEKLISKFDIWQDYSQSKSFRVLAGTISISHSK